MDELYLDLKPVTILSQPLFTHCFPPVKRYKGTVSVISSDPPCKGKRCESDFAMFALKVCRNSPFKKKYSCTKVLYNI